MFEDFGTQGGARYRWDMLEIGGNLFQYNDKTKRRKVGPNAPMKKLDHEQINNGRPKKTMKRCGKKVEISMRTDCGRRGKVSKVSAGKVSRIIS